MTSARRRVFMVFYFLFFPGLNSCSLFFVHKSPSPSGPPVSPSRCCSLSTCRCQPHRFEANPSAAAFIRKAMMSFCSVPAGMAGTGALQSCSGLLCTASDTKTLTSEHVLAGLRLSANRAFQARFASDSGVLERFCPERF